MRNRWGIAFIVLLVLSISCAWIYSLAGEPSVGEISTLINPPTETPTRRPTATPIPATPTATPPPVQISEAAWDGVTVHTICLEYQENYPQIEDNFPASMERGVVEILNKIGIQVVDPGAACEAALAIETTVEMIGANYINFSSACYTGYRGEVLVKLSHAETNQVIIESHEIDREPPEVILESDCHTEISGGLHYFFDRYGYNHRLERAILDSLVHFWGPDILLPILEFEDDFLYTAIDMFAESGVMFVPDLQQSLAQETTRRGAILALQEIGPDAAAAVPELVQILLEEDEFQQKMAARAIGVIGLQEAVPRLIDLYADCDLLEEDVQNMNCKLLYHEALELISGEKFLLNVDEWRRWWGEQ